MDPTPEENAILERIGKEVFEGRPAVMLKGLSSILGVLIAIAAKGPTELEVLLLLSQAQVKRAVEQTKDLAVADQYKDPGAARVAEKYNL